MWQAVGVGGDCANIIASLVYTKPIKNIHQKITNRLLNNEFHR